VSSVTRDRRLGAQLWLERDATAARVDQLVATAAVSGLGLLRVFLMWPWIESRAGQFDFEIFDYAFDAAGRHGLRIKATLTANSGPWHIGTPGALHSHTLLLDPEARPAVERYVTACVERYAEHPALAQWVIWNEPFNVVAPVDDPPVRGSDERAAWHVLLHARYRDIEQLNRRWLTGYRSFAEVPFPEELPHPSHRRIAWLSYGPWIDEYHHRAAWLTEQVSWVAELVRRVDGATPLCANPSFLFDNHAMAGYRFPGVTSAVDVTGASFHPPWSFGFVAPARHAALIASATAFLRLVPGVTQLEVTETQVGPVTRGSPNPDSLVPAQLASHLLVPFFAGAQTVTGWLLNARRQDFEAGDWALLDDDDGPTERSAMVRRVDECLAEVEAEIGVWTPQTPDVLVLGSSDSQAVEMLDARVNAAWETTAIPGRRRGDGVQAMYTLANALLGAGVTAAPCPIEAIRNGGDLEPRLLVAAHLLAYSQADGERLLELVADGATLLIDGMTGHKTPDAELYRPWPGVLADPLGFRGRGLNSGRDGFVVTLHGAPIARLVLAVADLEFIDPSWEAWSEVRVGPQDSPLIWQRGFGDGSVIVVCGTLGASAVVDPGIEVLVRHIVASTLPDLRSEVRCLGRDGFALRVEGERGDAVGVFAPDAVTRGGQPLRVALPQGEYRDVWSGELLVARSGELSIPAPEGVAVMARRRRSMT
jgi:hypothetical protein